MSNDAPPPDPPPTPAPPWRPRGWSMAAIVLAVVVIVGGLGAAAFQAAFLSDIPAIPDPDALWAVRRSPGMTFLDHNGAFIAARGAKYGARVTLAELPAYVPRAFLAAEDRRFYSHGAVDPRAILRAARRDLAEGRAAEGGSTLSQQLARTLFLSPAHTFKRKVQEAVLASRLEGMLGKDGVLDLYLNRAYFGAGAYGLDAAAQTYFGKPARELSLAQAAVLAAVPNAPSRLAPSNNMAGAWARAGRILVAMRGEGWIRQADEDQALAAPPDLAPPRQGEGDWSYILDDAAAQAGGLAGGASDLVVRLTIDPKLQALGLASVRDVVRAQGRGRAVSQGAMVALAPDGAIRVMVGGLDHQASAYNRATQARRQPGSAFKAFVFGAAMEAGVRPTDTRQDAPVALGRWNPSNYGGRYAGAVTIEQALARSINTIAVRLTLEIGPAQVAGFARRCGLADIPANPGPSIALGAYEVSLLQLAGGYQVFQSGGGRTTPYLIESLTTTAGQSLYAHGPSSPLPVYDPLYASRMVRMLKAVMINGTGTAAAIGRPAAGKTGTSQNWRDAWFVGFTPDLLAAVWVGNDNGRPMAKVTGGELPAAIWRRFMMAAEKDVPPTDFTWLVPEPQEPPLEAPLEPTVDGAPVYQDQPPMLDADGPVPDEPARPPPRDAGDDGPDMAPPDEPGAPDDLVPPPPPPPPGSPRQEEPPPDRD